MSVCSAVMAGGRAPRAPAGRRNSRERRRGSAGRGACAVEAPVRRRSSSRLVADLDVPADRPGIGERGGIAIGRRRASAGEETRRRESGCSASLAAKARTRLRGGRFGGGVVAERADHTPRSYGRR